MSAPSVATLIQLSRKWLGRGQGGGEGGFRFGSLCASMATLPPPPCPPPETPESCTLQSPTLWGFAPHFFRLDFGSALTCALKHPVVKTVYRGGHVGVSSPPSCSHPAFNCIPLGEEGARTPAPPAWWPRWHVQCRSHGVSCTSLGTQRATETLLS